MLTEANKKAKKCESEFIYFKFAKTFLCVLYTNARSKKKFFQKCMEAICHIFLKKLVF